MLTYTVAVVLATAVAARTIEEPRPSRRWRWLAAIALTSGFATVLAVRALQHGRIAAFVFALTFLLAYVTWPLMCRPTTRPHWTVAAAAAAGSLMLVGYGAAAVLTSGWLWGDVVLSIIGLTIVAVASIAWGLVGSLWLRHRAVLDTRPAPLAIASEVITALPAAPTPIAALPAAPARALPAALHTVVAHRPPECARPGPALSAPGAPDDRARAAPRFCPPTGSTPAR